MPLGEASRPPRPEGDTRPVPPVAARVDAELAEIDARIDWLHHLSPLDNDAMWDAFVASGYREAPVLRYPEPPRDLGSLRERLLEQPIREIEPPLIEALLHEKQRELDLQFELVRLRDTAGFVSVSVELFRGTDPGLLDTARTILTTVEREDDTEHYAGCEQVVAAAEAELSFYREQAPDLRSRVIVMDDLNSMMMVNHGDFYVARSTRVPVSRVRPLVAHEIGTHVVTRHNGRVQPLRLMEVGLAHYDALQEGLATLAEYLAGYLPPRRLRVLAARVVAAEMAVERQGIVEIFDHLHHEHGMLADDAFDVAVRACRGGGLTKDAVYLRGLQSLLVYLAGGGEIEPLYVGKLSMSQRPLLEQLAEEGWLRPPAILPRFLSEPGGRARLRRARELTVESLHQSEPQP